MVQCKSLDLAVLFTVVLLSGHVHGTAGKQMQSAQSANCSTSCGSDKVPCKRLQLMVVLPLHIQPFKAMEEKSSGVASKLILWDRGLEILPAAYVAADHINRAAGLLPGVELEVVAVNSSLCGQPKGSETSALVEFTREVFKERKGGECLLGVTGLFCDSSAALISSVATTARLHLLQLSGSASPSLEVGGGSDSSPLYRMVASSSSYCEAVLALMDTLHWERIAIISEAFISYYTSTANQCHQIINEANITTVATLDNIVTEAVSSSYVHNSRVFLLSTSASSAANILCSAYNKNIRWPHYAWITYDHTPSDLMAHSTACSSETMRLALNGLIMLRYNLEAGQPAGVETTTKLVRDYKAEYFYSLRKTENNSGLGHGSLEPNEYANVLYDSILAFAYAFNNSCSPLLPDKNNIVDSACGRIDNISFQGVSGHIEFNERQVDTPITLYHFNNESLVTLAHYLNGNFSVVNKAYKSMNLQVRDEIHYNLLPVPLTALVAIIITFLFLVSFVMMVLFLVFRSEPEIKATSSYLSLNLFVGCYLCFVCLLIIVFSSFVVLSGIARILVCQGIIWTGVLGVNFILAPLLLRMIRIYYIFHHFGRIGKICSDWTLFGATLAIVGSVTSVLLLWLVIDPYTIVDFEMCVPSMKQSIYCVVQFCSSDHAWIWYMVMGCEIGILSLALVIMSVLTRKIKRSNFKDTKKVSTFIVMLVVVICGLVPLWWVIRYEGDSTSRHIILYLGYGTIAVLCQLFLFVPKVYPALLRCIQGRAPPKPKLHSTASPDKEAAL